MDLYVATNGKNHLFGRLPAPNEAKNDEPFASLQAVRDLILNIGPRADGSVPEESARLLADGRAVSFRQEGSRLFLDKLPSPLPDSLCTTVELELDGKPQTLAQQTSFWVPG